MKKHHLITITTVLILLGATKLSAQIKAADFKTHADVITLKYPTGVSIADIDGDGKKDVIIANQGIGSVSVYRNTVAANGDISSLTFETRLNFATNGSGLESLVVADVNQDGLPDILGNSYNGTSLYIFRNTSTPGIVSFATRTNIAMGYSTHSMAIGDINGDGKPDLVAVNGDAGTATLFRNTSTTAAISFTSVNITVGGNLTGVALADFDGNGKMDMSILAHDKALLSIYRNIATGTNIDATTFAPRQDIPTEVGAYAMAAADLNADGKADLAITNVSDKPTVSVFRNTSVSGTIGFSFDPLTNNFATSVNPLSIKLLDINGDSKPEIVIGSWTNNGTVIILQNKTVSGSVAFYPPVSLPVGSNPQGLDIADLNADSKPDIVSANGYTGNFSVLQYEP